MKISITDEISIDKSTLSETFIRAGGPGGQNVNKVSTAVQLRFDLSACNDLPDDMKKRAEKLAGNRLTKEGEILIQASEHRTREKNREAALHRLIDLLKQASIIPRPRLKRKRSQTENRKRLESKKRQGKLKKLRQKPNTNE